MLSFQAQTRSGRCYHLLRLHCCAIKQNSSSIECFHLIQRELLKSKQSKSNGLSGLRVRGSGDRRRDRKTKNGLLFCQEAYYSEILHFFFIFQIPTRQKGHNEVLQTSYTKLSREDKVSELVLHTN